ncbi:helix-turn-helix transcriptional regulator [Streptomyces sp. KR80]|uniref:helix-turn-helix transcriptional regulator n=1 Tax=Streptomyces sp. KR80 TaxID=3457426 RepID=UPI003FD4D712
MADRDLLVGRAAELDQICQMVSDLAAGIGRVLWIEGEPGIGKSALLSAAQERAEHHGVRTFRGLAQELSQRFPLRLMLDCLDPQRMRITSPHDSSPASGGAPLLPVDPVMAMVETLVAEVEQLCAEGPVLLVLDDIQWADEASLLAWQRLNRLVRQLPLMLAVGCRPVPRRAEIAQVRRAVAGDGAVLMSLGALPPAEVEELVGSLLGALPGPALRHLMANTGGNPLYVREAVAAYEREGRIQIGERTVADLSSDDRVGDPTAPTPLASVIADRLTFLSEDTLELLRMAALLGMEFSVSALGVVTGRTAIAMISAIDEAVDGGVLVECDAGLGFRHGLIRQVLYEGLPAGLRVALHLQVARALDEAGMPTDRVAEHLVVVPDGIDGWLLDWLSRSADTLIHRAPHVAAELLSRALDARVVEPSVRTELKAHLVTVMFLLARYDEVNRLTRHIGEGGNGPAPEARLVWNRAYALLRLGQYDDALHALDGYREVPGAEAVWTARLSALRAVVLGSAGRFDEGQAAAEGVLAEPDPDPLAAGYAQHALSGIPSSWHRPDIALGHLDRGLACIGEHPNAADLRVLLLSNRVAALDGLDRPAEADTAVAELLKAAEVLGVPVRVAMSRLTAAEHWYLWGRWDDAAAELEVLEQELLDAHLPWRLRMHGLGALLAVHRDDERDAERHLNAVSMLDVPTGDARRSLGHLALARAERAERAGDPASALAVLKDVDYNAYPHLILPQLTRIAVACDDRESAASAVESAVAASTTRMEQATAHWCTGLLAGDPGPLLDAAEGIRSLGQRFEWGRILEDAAVLLAAQGDATGARLHYDEAIERYKELGARADIRRADARLRAHGVRRGQRGTRRRPETGWKALTPTERRVTELVATGQSNQDIATSLFLSRRTVETHISHILRKLGVRSRTEIALEAVRHGNTCEATA